MNYKVSILIPVYNNEAVVERCLCSVFEQKLDEIEYIIIDDFSSDDSLNLCRDVANRYLNRKQHTVIIANDKNQGIAAVRQMLVDNAHGEYIYFVDSDDWIEPYATSLMYEKAKAEDADIVGSNYFINTRDSERVVDYLYPAENKNCLNLFLRMNIKPVIWLFLFKRHLFTEHHIIFDKGINIMEDYIAGTKLLFHANKVAHIDLPAYHYYIGNNFYSRDSATYFQVAEKAIRHAEDYLRLHGNYCDFEESLLIRKLILKSKFLFENMALDSHRYLDTFPEANGCWRRFGIFPIKQNILMFLAEKRFHCLFAFLRKIRKQQK